MLGDLNLWGGTPDRADPASEYNHLMRGAGRGGGAPALRRPLARDPPGATPRPTSGTKPRLLEDGSLRPREKRIDFVLLAGAARASRSRCAATSCRATCVVDGEPVGDLSNHAALFAEIAWRPRADPLTVAAGERQPRP